MYKVYVVLTRTKTIVSRAIHFVSKDDYTHASISLDRTLDVMYSFARKRTYNPFVGRFCTERLDQGVFGLQKTLPGVIIELGVSKEQHGKVVELLNQFIQNSHLYKYNYVGLINNLLQREVSYENRFVCSEFVYYILSESGICNFAIARNLVKPQNLLSLRGDVIFKGDLRKYRSYLPQEAENANKG